MSILIHLAAGCGRRHRRRQRDRRGHRHGHWPARALRSPSRYLSQESAQRVAKQIEADGGRALAVALDIADRACVEAGLAAVRANGLGPSSTW